MVTQLSTDPLHMISGLGGAKPISRVHVYIWHVILSNMNVIDVIKHVLLQN